MRRSQLNNLPAIECPAPYSLRTYRPGDEAAWAEIMNTGIGQDWTAERCREKLTGLPQFRPDGLYFAVVSVDDRELVVGSTCAWTRDPAETCEGIVHMVCVRPDHRGHRLGYWLTLAVLHYFRDHDFAEAMLTTDDFRLPAIRAYLALGFEPEMTHQSHPERWNSILQQLGSRPRPGNGPG
jgi:mycothiol synthase